MDLMDENLLVLDIREGMPLVLAIPEDQPPIYGSWDGQVYEVVGSA
jgi:hypothetical protein